MGAANLQLLMRTSGADEARLPESEPLTLTRNFAWVFMMCMAVLATVPLMIAWMASAFLK